MIYKFHPKLAPFIGKLYPKASLKILFLGESHYLPAAYNHKVGQEWYEHNTTSYDFGLPRYNSVC